MSEVNYGINDIESLSFREGVRKRIQMYLGSNDMQGVYNGITEIISNSVDEYYMGYGKQIDIDVRDNMVTIIDRGRGIPFGIREDGSNVLVDIFSRPHTGGKFNDKAYNSVGGLNGIGAKATCLSSESFAVASNRDGKTAIAVFEKGVLKNYQEVPHISQYPETGTVIKFKPDSEVFSLEPVNISFARICEQCQNLSYLTKGLMFKLTDGTQTKQYCALKGIVDLVRDKGQGAIHPHPAYAIIEEGDTTLEVAMQWTKGPESWYVFTNGIPQIEGGTSLTGMKTAITRFMKGKIGGDFNGDTARMGLVYVVACKTPRPSFANQIKSKINNPELNGLAQRATTQALTDFCKDHPDEFKLIEDILQRQRKAEQAAERARNAVLRATKDIEKNIRAKVFSSDKLKDAKKLGKDSVLLICEGKSAVNALALGRDPNKYGLLEIRGKIINCLTNPLEKVMENEEVKLIFSALGVTPNNYKAGKLRYGKVGIATDADKDGNHIALLLLSFFSEMLPDMLKEGRIMRLLSPTHLVKAAGQEFFFYSDEEFRKRTVRGETVLVKGLGELTAGQIKTSMFGSKQHLVPFNWTPEDDALLRNFMGDDIEFRKDYLFNHCDFSQITE